MKSTRKARSHYAVEQQIGLGTSPPRSRGQAAPANWSRDAPKPGHQDIIDYLVANYGVHG